MFLLALGRPDRPARHQPFLGLQALPVPLALPVQLAILLLFPAPPVRRAIRESRVRQALPVPQAQFQALPALLVPLALPVQPAILLPFQAPLVRKAIKGFPVRRVRPVPHLPFLALLVPPAPSRQLLGLPVQPALPLLSEPAFKAIPTRAMEQQQRLLQQAELPLSQLLFWKTA